MCGTTSSSKRWNLEHLHHYIYIYGHHMKTIYTGTCKYKTTFSVKSHSELKFGKQNVFISMNVQFGLEFYKWKSSWLWGRNVITAQFYVQEINIVHRLDKLLFSEFLIFTIVKNSSQKYCFKQLLFDNMLLWKTWNLYKRNKRW